MRRIDDENDEDDDDEDHCLEVLEDKVRPTKMMMVEFVARVVSVVLYPMDA